MAEEANNLNLPHYKSVADLDEKDLRWFSRETLRCIRWTIPGAVEADLEVGGKFLGTAHLSLRLPQEPEGMGIRGCVRVGSFTRDLPKAAKNEVAYRRAMCYRGLAIPMEEPQEDPARKQHQPAYLRIRLDELGHALIHEYLDSKLRWVPAECISFLDGSAPSAATKAWAMRVQDNNQLRSSVTFNVELLVYLFRKRLFQKRRPKGLELVAAVGVAQYDTRDYLETRSIRRVLGSYIHDLQQSQQTMPQDQIEYPVVTL
ncbi:hypothetical protein PG993_004166 [Apiospora rasikravindrae]|uniref:Uncharacterized protein n=1 Tax=Apiospora rasikravindrae TaxID=990691 RepID=A0ABR1TC12_9PEZI